MRFFFAILWVTIFLLFVLAACQNNVQQEKDSEKETTIITNDTIPLIRTSVKEQPIATYSVPVPDELNKWNFEVSIYETPQTFKFLMKVKYRELRLTDTVKIPNFGINPEVELQKGKKEFSCIIGFRDKKNVFKDYKLVSAVDKDIKISTLKSYFVGSYKTKKEN